MLSTIFFPTLPYVFQCLEETINVRFIIISLQRRKTGGSEIGTNFPKGFQVRFKGLPKFKPLMPSHIRLFHHKRYTDQAAKQEIKQTPIKQKQNPPENQTTFLSMNNIHEL